MNRSNFPLFQITGWKFCETGLCDKINSYNRSLQECQKERANYSETDEICEVVIEIKIRFTQASANSIVECSDGKNGFAPQCAFGIHYAVAYSEIVSIHFSSFLLMLLNRMSKLLATGFEKRLLIVRPRGFQFPDSLRYISASFIMLTFLLNPF